MVETLYIKLVDRTTRTPWAVAAFNRLAGMALWHPVQGVWARDSHMLAPYFMLYEPEAWPITREEAAELVELGVGPRRLPHWRTVVSNDDAEGLPTAAARPARTAGE